MHVYTVNVFKFHCCHAPFLEIFVLQLNESMFNLTVV
jgi:hypothetical protein